MNVFFYIELSIEEKYISNKEYEEIYSDCSKIAAMIHALRNSLKITSNHKP